VPRAGSASTWPERYGGGERSALERYVVLEELLSPPGPPWAPTGCAERQSALLLMKMSPELLAPRIVPGIVRGETYFCIGMSEPDSGSDLASIRTRAVRTRAGMGGQRPQGLDLGRTSHALHDRAGAHGHRRRAARHAGMSQLLIDMKTPGITIRPVSQPAGRA
jgi:acyl-CoA dehydrogenase